MKRIISSCILVTGIILLAGCPPVEEGSADLFSLSVSTNTAEVTADKIEKIPDKASYRKGEEVTLKANSIPHYLFSSWSGGYNGPEKSISVTITSDMTVTANYDYVENVYPLGISTLPSATYGYIIPDPVRTEINEGETVTLTAVPMPGFMFVNWDSGSDERVQEFVMEDEVSCTANFESNIAYLDVVADAIDYVGNNKGTKIYDVTDIDGNDIGDVYLVPSPEDGEDGDCLFQDINWTDDNDTPDDVTDDIQTLIKIYDFAQFRQGGAIITSMEGHNYTCYHRYRPYDLYHFEASLEGFFSVDNDVASVPDEPAEVEYHITYETGTSWKINKDPAVSYYRIETVKYDWDKNKIEE
ncbi:MAG: hypothetical protein JW881_02720 [Spirochaetales bacterium]|nr:hypothetical protein [Spirochaetales bacterium]